MVTTESVTIKVPVGMSKYLVTMNPETELTRNALLLYPYILNQTISHGHAAEILGIRKSELIDLYDKLGYSYFDMTNLKRRRLRYDCYLRHNTADIIS